MIFKFVASMTFVDETFSTKLKPSDSKKMQKVFVWAAYQGFDSSLTYITYVINVNLKLANIKIQKLK
jgi:hypothetical protein